MSRTKQDRLALKTGGLYLSELSIVDWLPPQRNLRAHQYTRMVFKNLQNGEKFRNYRG